jgi:hypothetical protein
MGVARSQGVHEHISADPPPPHALLLSHRLPSACVPIALTGCKREGTSTCIYVYRSSNYENRTAIMFRFTELVFIAASWSLAAAHTVIVYPGWRGNNIHTNGTTSDTDASIKPGSIGINYENGTYGFPYGMQWMYPCTYPSPHPQNPNFASRHNN